MNEQLKEYLKTIVADSTASRYEYEINHFTFSKDRKKASYSEILDYIGNRRKQFKNSSSIGCTLQALKHYFSYLVEVGEREDNPAKSIRLRDKQSKDIQLQNLFSTQELELLLIRKERYILLKNRNLLIISLLIYQGLKSSEIRNLELSDIDLKEATIFIKSSLKSNSRTLKLNAKQVIYLMTYLNEDRPKLIRENTNKIIISKLGSVETGEGIGYLIETSKHLFPTKILNPQTIRQSVICNLLKAKNDLRIVQTFAGHKYPTTTERYKQTHLEELKNELIKFHPLK
jgi:integrase/recombinase XerD